MAATASDVLENRAPWACVQSDAEAFLGSLPDDSVDLLFTSPPYELARTYSLADRLPGGQAWVDWMVRLVTAAAPKVKGLIAINCEGQTRQYRYSCVPFLLIADLHRAGFNLRKPVVFHRVGIPGSGGPDWLRNDWEPVVCVTRAGRLPWSNPTACGRPPKYGVGGKLSHRMTDGDRVNMLVVRERVASGESQRSAPRTVGIPLKGTTSGTDDGGLVNEKTYVPPEMANPGNVVKCNIGGGKMGHELCHENEAPFPLKFAEFFVKSFAPPGGVVADCFSGSGTVCHAAVENNRRFVGCDLRESQVQLCERRMRSVTPSMFGDAA